MTAYLIDHPPRVRQFRDRGTKPSGVIVVHTAESTPDWVGPDAGAEAVAKFISTRSDYGSYHKLSDSDSRIQVVPFEMQAYGDGTGSNPHAIHLSAATQAAKWNQATKAWREATVKNMARDAADAARWLKKHHGIDVPARRITRAQSEARAPGFISHGERDPGRRSDPGASFPWDLFLSTYAAEMRGTVTTSEEPDMDLSAILKLKVPNRDGLPNIGEMIAQTYNKVGYAMAHARNADKQSRESLRLTGELANLVGNATLSPEDRTALAEDIAARTAAAVERLDAEAVADKLEINVKE